MLIDLDNLPSDPALLQRLLRDMAVAVESRDGEIERLQSIIRKLQRAQFGRRSERLDPDQLRSRWKTSMPTSPASGRADRAPIHRWSGHPTASRCPIICHEKTYGSISKNRIACAVAVHLHAIGESVSEMLDFRHSFARSASRPKYACRACETIAQVAADSRFLASRYRMRRPPRPPPHRPHSATIP
ncbi:hypothetical protein J2X13_005661 [Aminobacter aminovorans]|nr:hypothetical protein [Aminobacter aminovorans]